MFRIARQPRLIAGAGTLDRLPELLREDGHRTVAVITGGRSIRGREEWAHLTERLLDEGFEFLDFTVRGEPTPELVDGMVEQIRVELPGCDAVVAIGGGSVMDAGKAVGAGVALSGEAYGSGITRFLEGVGDIEHPGATLPMYAVPSTAGTGSEATKNAVLSTTGPDGFKKSLRHDQFIPHTAIIDPTLHIGTPQAVTRASGLDAITQLLEAYVSTAANPVTDALALQGLRLGGPALVRLLGGEDVPELRLNMALAAYLSGVCLANAGLGLVHGFASPVGALREIPHGVVCGLLVGPVTARTVELLQRSGDTDSLARYDAAAAAVLPGPGGGAGTVAAAEAATPVPVQRLVDWFRRLAAPLGGLGDYGFRKDELSLLAAATGMKNHPATMDAAVRESILEEVM
jgi:alcohol dehydrogenase class IV